MRDDAFVIGDVALERRFDERPRRDATGGERGVAEFLRARRRRRVVSAGRFRSFRTRRFWRIRARLFFRLRRFSHVGVGRFRIRGGPVRLLRRVSARVRLRGVRRGDGRFERSNPRVVVAAERILSLLSAPFLPVVELRGELRADLLVHQQQHAGPGRARALSEQFGGVPELVRVVHLLEHLRQHVVVLRVQHQDGLVVAQRARHLDDGVGAQRVAEREPFLRLLGGVHDPARGDGGRDGAHRPHDVLVRRLAEHREQHDAVHVGEVRQDGADVGVVQDAAGEHFRDEIDGGPAKHVADVRPLGDGLHDARRLGGGQHFQPSGPRALLRHGRVYVRGGETHRLGVRLVRAVGDGETRALAEPPAQLGVLIDELGELVALNRALRQRLELLPQLQNLAVLLPGHALQRLLPFLVLLLRRRDGTFHLFQIEARLTRLLADLVHRLQLDVRLRQLVLEVLDLRLPVIRQSKQVRLVVFHLGVLDIQRHASRRLAPTVYGQRRLRVPVLPHSLIQHRLRAQEAVFELAHLRGEEGHLAVQEVPEHGLRQVQRGRQVVLAPGLELVHVPRERLEVDDVVQQARLGARLGERRVRTEPPFFVSVRRRFLRTTENQVPLQRGFRVERVLHDGLDHLIRLRQRVQQFGLGLRRARRAALLGLALLSFSREG